MTPTRDSAIDAYRASALAVVVLGHWLLTVTWWHDGGLDANNLLELAPWTQWATWALQPVPLFFVVGGWSGARSWHRARATTTRARWVAARLERLLTPVVTFTVAALIGAAFLKLMVPESAATVARLLGMPLWFLAVYVPITALIPVLVDAVDRWGWQVPRDAAVAAIGVDLCRFGTGWDGFGWANFAFVWVCCAAIGIAAESRPPRRHGLLLAGLSAFGLLFITVRLGWYPVSMVGVGPRSNNTPPTVALLLLAVVHAAVAGWCAPVVRRRLDRGRVGAKAVSGLGAVGMHCYLWHLTATVVVVAVQQTGVGNVRPLTSTWWIVRPLVLLAYTSVAAPIVLLAARFDARRLRHPQRATASIGRVSVGVVAATVGLALIALRGFGLGPVALGAVAAVQAAAVLVTDRAGPTADPEDEGKPPWSPAVDAPKVGA